MRFLKYIACDFSKQYSLDQVNDCFVAATYHSVNVCRMSRMSVQILDPVFETVIYSVCHNEKKK